MTRLGAPPSTIIILFWGCFFAPRMKANSALKGHEYAMGMEMDGPCLKASVKLATISHCKFEEVKCESLKGISGGIFIISYKPV